MAAKAAASLDRPCARRRRDLAVGTEECSTRLQPRPFHPKKDAEAQETFEQSLAGLLKYYLLGAAAPKCYSAEGIVLRSGLALTRQLLVELRCPLRITTSTTRQS